MDLENVLWMLTALGVVVVLLTHMRMRATAARTGHAALPQGVATGHTVVGVLALATWIAYLLDPGRPLGLAALGLWWVVTLLGLLILTRWLPSGGGHAQDAGEDTWADGPALSIIAHVGTLLGVCVFTWAVLADKVTG